MNVRRNRASKWAATGRGRVRHGAHTANPGWLSGQYWVECQRCGLDYRAKHIRKQWDGLIVCESCWEPRHSQDFVRGRADQMRPRGPSNPVGLVVMDSTTGSTSIPGGTFIGMFQETPGSEENLGVLADQTHAQNDTITTISTASVFPSLLDTFGDALTITAYALQDAPAGVSIDSSGDITGTIATGATVTTHATCVQATYSDGKVQRAPFNWTITALVDPTTIPDLAIWWDFADDTTTWKDAARTMPATMSGDDVLGVTDKSGSGNHASSANGPKLLNVFRSGNNVVDLETAFATLNGPDVQLTWPLTIFIAQPRGDTEGVIIGSDPTTGISNHWRYWPQGGTAPDKKYRVENVDTSVVVRTTQLWNAASDNEWKMVTLRLDATTDANNTIAWNNILLTTEAQDASGLDATASGNIRLGADSGGSNLWREEIGEVLVYTRLLTDAEQLAIWTILDSKWQFD